MNTDNYSQLKTRILDILWNETDFDAAVRRVLILVGNEFSADSVYISEYSVSDSQFINTYLWTAPGFMDSAWNRKDTNQKRLAAQKGAFAMGSTTAFWSTDTLPEESAAILKRLGTRSLLQAPIQAQGHLAACIGLSDSVRFRTDWEGNTKTRECVMTIAQIIGIFLLKTRYEQINGDYQNKLEKSLLASQKRTDAAYDLLDSISSGVILVRLYPDGRAKPLYANLGMYRILRIPRTAEDAVVPDRNAAVLESEYFDDFFANIPEPDNQWVRQDYQEGFKKDHFSVKKYRLLRGDGTYVWVRSDLSLRESTAECRIYYATYTDMSEEISLQSNLMEMLQKEKQITADLEKANRAKSDFLSRMSHDIRTPMNVIAGMTEIASSHLSEPERTKDCLQKIRLSSHHLLGLINDVLDMSKIENGNFHINTLPISLPAVLREVIMITLAGIREKGQVFDVHLMNLEDEQFCSDALRLRQILLNLLSNACKFTPVSGRVVFEVEQMVAEQKSKQKGMGRMTALRFTVSDTGAGMSQEFLEHIFEAFTREQDSRTDQIEGSGLGMCITKRLVDMMDGTITVKSQPGKGTSFQVTLPMKVVPEKGGNAIWEEGSNAIDGVHILLADHDPVVLTHGCQALTALGVEAECAGSGEEAAAMVLSRHREGRDFSMVILDADLSEPNWLETARRIRNAGANGQPCLIISAFDWNDRKEEAIKAGICGFVEKPLFHSALENCIMEHLNGKAQPVHQPLTFDFSGRTFLLVEDNELNREIALELLGNLGASLETAVNGEEAVNRFKESPPGFYSLILMDIQMPVMNGYEAARAIRSLGRADAVSVPIIAMTADAFVEDIQNSKAAGMNGHMAKPLDYEGMSREISKYLNNDYKRREDFYE